MQPGLPEALTLLGRIQYLLAVYRLWLHELRGRLDIAFIEISALRIRSSDFEAIRREVARIFFNFNSRLQRVEDTFQASFEDHSALISSVALRLQRTQRLGVAVSILFLQTLRLLWEIFISHETT